MPPPNISFATAASIGTLSGTTPTTIVLDVEDGGTFYTVWYKYTAVAGDNEIGAFAFGDLSNYLTFITVWLTASSLHLDGMGATDVPVQFPVTPGTTYYFKIEPTGTRNPAGNSTLTFSVRRHVSVTAPAGSLVINDDTNGYPLAILSATDGHVLQFRQGFPAGEDLHILHSDNRMLFTNTFVNPAVCPLYNTTDFSHITDVAQEATSIGGARSARFYIASQATPHTIRTVGINGAVGGTSWSPLTAGLSTIAPNNAETILYWSRTSVGNRQLRRWDLIGNVALADLAAEVADHSIRYNLVVLADDTIIAGYTKHTAPFSFFFRRYHPDGTILHTYDFATFPTTGGFTSINRICADPDGTSFWVWLQASGLSRFIHVATDGTILISFTGVLFSAGVSQPDPTANPAAFFGHSPSCHFGILPTALAPPGGEQPPACVQGCLVSPDAITGGGQACRPDIDMPSGGGQACRTSAGMAPSVECA